MYKITMQNQLKLIALNIWGGYLKQPLIEFIKSYKDVDVFCLQEVYNNAAHKMATDEKEYSLNILSELQKILTSHDVFFTDVTNHNYGIAIFIKKEIKVLDRGEFIIYDNINYSGIGPTHSRKLQWIRCHIKSQEYAILNVHGLWNGMGKIDTPDRLSQSHKIREFIDSLDIPIILCGDFNLMPDTESIKIVGNKMRNLIKINNIKSTRTNIYEKPERYADYIFLSSQIAVSSFKVLEDKVSDHSPLFLEIEI